MKKVIGIILIVGAIVLAYLGYQEYSNATVGVEIGDLELSAGDSQSQTQAYIMWGAALIAVIVGGKMASS